MKRLLTLLKRYVAKPESVYLVAMQNQVILTSGVSGTDRVIMSPDLARKLSDELKAFAAIAERFNTEGVQATVQP
jgi:hypothetical protein